MGGKHAIPIGHVVFTVAAHNVPRDRELGRFVRQQTNTTRALRALKFLYALSWRASAASARHGARSVGANTIDRTLPFRARSHLPSTSSSVSAISFDWQSHHTQNRRLSTNVLLEFCFPATKRQKLEISLVIIGLWKDDIPVHGWAQALALRHR